MEIQQKISARKLRRFRDRHVTALVEGPSKDTPLVWEARIEGMAPEIDGKLYLNDIEVEGTGISARTGDIAIVEVTETHEYDLIGRVVEILNLPAPAAAQLPGRSAGPARCNRRRPEDFVLSSAGFSLRGLVLARPNPRRLKPAPQSPATLCHSERIEESLFDVKE